LSTIEGGDAVPLTSVGSYATSYFEKVSSSATFNPASTSVVSFSNAVLRSVITNNYQTGDALIYSVTGDRLTGLTNQATYYAIADSATDFRLASSRENALSNSPISLGTDGGGIHQFTKVEPISQSTVIGAIATNASNRAKLGAQLNVLDYAIDNLQTLSNNLSEAYSRIVDTDYAAETAAFTRNQILQQAATSMLAQANQMPNVILTLLK
jgi:flagellin